MLPFADTLMETFRPGANLKTVSGSCPEPPFATLAHTLHLMQNGSYLLPCALHLTLCSKIASLYADTRCSVMHWSLKIPPYAKKSPHGPLTFGRHMVQCHILELVGPTFVAISPYAVQPTLCDVPYACVVFYGVAAHLMPPYGVQSCFSTACTATF